VQIFILSKTEGVILVACFTKIEKRGRKEHLKKLPHQKSGIKFTGLYATMNF